MSKTPALTTSRIATKNQDKNLAIALHAKKWELINMNGYDFERCVIETIAELADLKGVKQDPMAVAAWPQCKSPGARWRQMRSAKIAQRLPIGDACQLCAILGMSFIEVCGLAQAKLMQKKAGQDVNFRVVNHEALPDKQEAITESEKDKPEDQKCIEA